MTIAITDEHREISAVVRQLLEDADVRADARAALDDRGAALPTVWKRLGDQGWLGLHVSEQAGGSGAGLPELVIVVEELGRAAVHGPLLATLTASAILERRRGQAAATDVIGRALTDLATGATTAGVCLHEGMVRAGDGTLTGRGVALGTPDADVLLVVSGEDLLVLTPQDGWLAPTEVAMDPGLATSTVTLDGVTVPADRVLSGAADLGRRILRTLMAATAAGVARRTTEMAVAYAGVREQFGRPIATFQAIKHHCAVMLGEAELATAVAWDAARIPADDPRAGLAAATASTVALEAAVRCAELNLQVHGGIGYTWEHDVHLYLRRARGLQALADGLPDAGTGVARWTAAHGGRTFDVDLPEEAEQFRGAARTVADAVADLEGPDRQRELARSGYLVPHWPAPWGRAAGPVEQLVIEQELADITRPSLGITGWVVLTLAQHGTDDQRERWVMPALEGDVRWCQLFSEPEAGSDAAAVRTRARRVEGGWVVNGQKVWTSSARECAWGLATVRTNPDAPKHRGITTVAIDMAAEGVTIRPLREITGHEMFNEVFFDDVFVPDADVVGEVDDGWRVARDTLGNERVSIGGGSIMPFQATDLAQGTVEGVTPREDDLPTVGRLVAREHALRLLNLRAATRAVVGASPGAEGNVAKMLLAIHEQDVADLAVRLSSRDGHGVPSSAALHSYLAARCLTIAGGTTEVVKNVIAERLLGMPREPGLR